ncbi:hypothetical protein SS50377_27622 [Spironucleus salmonicida]|uniref:C2H2-type domain-containing protein n=1 Tax=Spironucleus salmonicida TaxID=348837 RepID=V6LPR6_9EUKA|nr:hypothetical protein SS50377_27622 [Spironucleus salmonicida]|eukprot:EST46600.1 hypothetical protein SS50377_13404 [Spironucleus salmonicida]
MNRPIDNAIFNFNPNDVQYSNSIIQLQPYLNSLIFGDFTQCSQQQLLIGLQLNQLCSQYFLQQADIVESQCQTQIQNTMNQQKSPIEVQNYQNQISTLNFQLQAYQQQIKQLQLSYNQRNQEYLTLQQQVVTNQDQFKINQLQQEIDILRQQLQQSNQATSCKNNQFQSGNSSTNELNAMKQQYQLLVQENKRLVSLQQAPPYMKQMAAIKQANELIRQENIKLKKQVTQVQGAFHRCQVCFKFFESDDFLKQHIKRRHQPEDTLKMSKIISSYSQQNLVQDQKSVYKENFYVSPIIKQSNQQPIVQEHNQLNNDIVNESGSFDSVLKSLEEIDKKLAGKQLQNVVKDQSGISDKIQKLNEKTDKLLNSISAIEGVSVGELK